MVITGVDEATRPLRHMSPLINSLNIANVSCTHLVLDIRFRKKFGQYVLFQATGKLPQALNDTREGVKKTFK